MRMSGTGTAEHLLELPIFEAKMPFTMILVADHVPVSPLHLKLESFAALQEHESPAKQHGKQVTLVWTLVVAASWYG